MVVGLNTRSHVDIELVVGLKHKILCRHRGGSNLNTRSHVNIELVVGLNTRSHVAIELVVVEFAGRTDHFVGFVGLKHKILCRHRVGSYLNTRSHVDIELVVGLNTRSPVDIDK